MFLAICLTSRVACILTRQSGSPSFGTTSEVPTQSRPDAPSKILLRSYSKPKTKPGVVPKIHHLYFGLSVTSLLGKLGLEELEQSFPVSLSHVLSFRFTSFTYPISNMTVASAFTIIYSISEKSESSTFCLPLSLKEIQPNFALHTKQMFLSK